MRLSLLALALATAVTPLAVATPVAAQTRAEQYRWEQAQRRFDNERAIYEAERARYERARRRGRYGGGYDDDYRWRGGDRDWDASRYYREDTRYSERRLGPDDEVYRGSDGRYYCRRSDGTTGLIIGGAGGAILGNVIDGGRSRTAGTLIGGALGALLGRSVDQNTDVRCR